MKRLAGGEGDTSSECYNFDDQLAASKNNAFSELNNPCAEPMMLFRSARRKKIIRKSSSALWSAYNLGRKIKELVRKSECASSYLEHITSLVQRAVEAVPPRSAKLDALVAAALYLVLRLNSSLIFLSQIYDTYGLRPAEVAKAIEIYKKHGIIDTVPTLDLCSLYEKLVDLWFPYGSDTFPALLPRQHSEDLELSFKPTAVLAKAGLFTISPSPASSSKETQASVRNTVLRIGRFLLGLPEVDSIKDGRNPKAFLSGIFHIAFLHCGIPNPAMSISTKLEISKSTVKNNSSRIEECLEARICQPDGQGELDSKLRLKKISEFLRSQFV